ncbi:MAG: FmdB family zinc ribbon protein [Desulfurella sp.]|uniref:FmdB family zinc ribbon protein n=1 Tax=Desulfurella sp. TaxID=1962857 RepID=UPI003CAD2302
MPIYEYKCSACGESIELMQKMGAKAPKTCPVCGAVNTLKKLISNTSFELKGSGWYVTDYKNNPKSTTSKVESNKGEIKNAGKDTVNH